MAARTLTINCKFPHLRTCASSGVLFSYIPLTNLEIIQIKESEPKITNWNNIYSFKFRQHKSCHHSIYNAVYSRLFVSIQELCVCSPFGDDPPKSSNLKLWDQLEGLDVDEKTIIKWTNWEMYGDNCNWFGIFMVVFNLMLCRSRRHSCLDQLNNCIRFKESDTFIKTCMVCLFSSLL